MTKIKERIMQFVEIQGIKKGIFFEKIDVSSANFRGNAINTPLNSSTIENIIANYPEINLHWLITGKGNMLLNEDKLDKVEEPVATYLATNNESYDLLLQNYNLLKEQNALQEELINMLKEKVDFTQDRLTECQQEKNISKVTK